MRALTDRLEATAETCFRCERKRKVAGTVGVHMVTDEVPVAALVVRFFQAEDGIRDIGVTGVQTCALPIYGPGRLLARAGAPPGKLDEDGDLLAVEVAIGDEEGALLMLVGVGFVVDRVTGHLDRLGGAAEIGLDLGPGQAEGAGIERPCWLSPRARDAAGKHPR